MGLICLPFNPKYIFSFFLLFLFFSCHQKVIPILAEKQNIRSSETWKRLESYPQKRGRTDDLSFVTPDMGWVVNSRGVQLKTEDGGKTWKRQFEKEESFFRCIEFKDSLNGWLGTLGKDDAYLHSTDSIVLYETRDGGENWTPTKIAGEYPKGLCGMQQINDDMIVACGRVRGPSYFLKTIDGGETWISKNLNHLAGSLIAPYFFNEKDGILVGGTTRDKDNCRSLILSTNDGGENWDTLFVSSQTGEYLWKVSFPSENNGFISVQRNNDEGRTTLLKSTDGGKSWDEVTYIDEPYYAQGIGFVNDSIGWIGGSFKYSYETRDGGKNWSRMSTGLGINNFQFIDDTTGYMVGRGVYKMGSLTAPKSGWEIAKFDDGSLQSKRFYVDGVLDGESFSYYSNGNLNSVGNFSKNLKDGKWKFYNESGSLNKEIKYNNGLAKISKKSLKKFEGIYEMRENSYVLIFYKNKQLYFTAIGSDKVRRIHPESETTFFYDDDFDVKVSFVKSDDGQVSHFILYRPGREWKVKKIKGDKYMEMFKQEKEKWNAAD